LDHYDSQSDEEAVAEDEASFEAPSDAAMTIPIPDASLTPAERATLSNTICGDVEAARALDRLGLLEIDRPEEYHARDLPTYYRQLQGGRHHNYCLGRANADLTPWLEYFVRGVAHVFGVAKEEALRLA